MSWDNKDNPWGKKRKPNIDLDDFSKIFNGGNNKFNKFIKKDENNFSPKSFFFLAVIIFLIWLGSGFYVVQPFEEAVVLRLGEYNRTSSEGLRYHIPMPFEKIYKIDILSVNREEIGFRSNSSSGNFFKNTDSRQLSVVEESLMLTGDQNIVDIFFEVQWKVRNSKDFLFNVRDKFGESTVKSVSESAMREVIGRSPISKVLTSDREIIQHDAQILAQKMIDDYGNGVDIIRLQMLKSDPPENVIDAFRDVQNAHKDKQREINKAIAYRNDITPKARGEAEKIIQDAYAYKEEVIAKSKGESERFIALHKEYSVAQDVTKKRIYLDTMQSIFKDINKVILDNKGQLLPYLPVDQLMKNKKVSHAE